MAGGSVTDWVAKTIELKDGLTVVRRTAEDLLIVKYVDSRPFPVAVTGVKDVVQPEHVQPVLSHATKPEFVVTVPSKALWSGAAISIVHATPAAFGTIGDLQKAARCDEVPAYRNRSCGFFEQAIKQHSNVSNVETVYREMFEAHRWLGNSLTIALIEAYNMSAEDVRNARSRFGRFDIAVKMTSYGSVTDAAEQAAASMGAEAMMFKDLMRRLGR